MTKRLFGAIMLSTVLTLSFIPIPGAVAAPQEFSGTTDDIIDITPIKLPSIVTIKYEGEGVFSASPCAASGK